MLTDRNCMRKSRPQTVPLPAGKLARDGPGGGSDSSQRRRRRTGPVPVPDQVQPRLLERLGAGNAGLHTNPERLQPHQPLRPCPSGDPPPEAAGPDRVGVCLPSAGEADAQSPEKIREIPTKQLYEEKLYCKLHTHIIIVELQEKYFKKKRTSHFP